MSFSYSRNVENHSVVSAIVISDVHLESGRRLKDIVTPSKNTPIIVAGDLGRVENTAAYTAAVRWLSENFMCVTLIPGNHEYYAPGTKTSMNRIDAYFQVLERQYRNVVILRNEWIVVQGMVVYGGILWSYVPSQNFKKQHLYNDDGSVVTCAQWNRSHFDHVQRIQEAIDYATERDYRCMIITHYAPSFRGTLHDKWANHQHNNLYATNLESMADNRCVEMWIYGHTGYNGFADHRKMVTNQCDHSGYRKDALLT
jgi:predicted phosphohydrolase